MFVVVGVGTIKGINEVDCDVVSMKDDVVGNDDDIKRRFLLGVPCCSRIVSLVDRHVRYDITRLLKIIGLIIFFFFSLFAMRIP